MRFQPMFPHQAQDQSKHGFHLRYNASQHTLGHQRIHKFHLYLQELLISQAIL